MAAMKHVIVTGAGGGIGSALVGDLREDGYVVTGIDASVESSERLQDRFPGVTAFHADVTQSSEVDRAVEQAMDAHGVPHGLVNLAGDNRLKPLEDITDNDWHHLVDANLSSAFYLCRAVMPRMREAGGGRVINTSSIFGVRGVNNDAAYAAAKAGVVGLTRALATEFGPAQVTVNAIAPVVVLTERVKKMPKEHLDKQLSTIPLGRFSTERDVNATIQFLLSDGGSFYTGQTFSPNGGDTMP
ncbi:SDR family NAD(P)-dependent oxidoreductase [Paramicrobacterium chengjingii]|uniref:SDR family NAD(P)-dependent oxidoreductase n=1 Tax=Paramicrobacterium chengjingii TaxID=2769067 RepID=UPI00142027C3|nr:SDR family NAD(P)-dependent oxidoreductase [Microbacterium chengjingii]